jgi:hypothetical protein
LLARKGTNEYFGPAELQYAILQALTAQANLSFITFWSNGATMLPATQNAQYCSLHVKCPI